MRARACPCPCSRRPPRRACRRSASEKSACTRRPAWSLSPFWPDAGRNRLQDLSPDRTTIQSMRVPSGSPMSTLTRDLSMGQKCSTALSSLQARLPRQPVLLHGRRRLRRLLRLDQGRRRNRDGAHDGERRSDEEQILLRLFLPGTAMILRVKLGGRIFQFSLPPSPLV